MDAIVVHLLPAVHHEFSRKCSWRISNSRFSPRASSPWDGFSNQPQTTPEAIIEIAIGKRKIDRNTPSPVTPFSSRSAQIRPKISVPTMNSTVSTPRFFSELRNRSSLNRFV
jgi:hypothetical protein